VGVRLRLRVRAEVGMKERRGGRREGEPSPRSQTMSGDADPARFVEQRQGLFGTKTHSQVAKQAQRGRSAVTAIFQQRTDSPELQSFELRRMRSGDYRIAFDVDSPSRAVLRPCPGVLCYFVGLGPGTSSVSRPNTRHHTHPAAADDEEGKAG
jgi:hypothetical protein